MKLISADVVRILDIANLFDDPKSALVILAEDLYQQSITLEEEGFSSVNHLLGVLESELSVLHFDNGVASRVPSLPTLDFYDNLRDNGKYRGKYGKSHID